MGYVVDQKSQLHSELGLLLPRLRSFAACLAGDDKQAQALTRAVHNHLLASSTKGRGHGPLALWAMAQMHKIWAGRNNGKQFGKADPRLFQPRSRVNDGGTSAQLALRIAQLSPGQRGALHLVYGERLSYDEVAEIFDVPVSEIISRLAGAHTALRESDIRGGRQGGSPNGADGRAPQSPPIYARGQAA